MLFRSSLGRIRSRISNLPATRYSVASFAPVGSIERSTCSNVKGWLQICEPSDQRRTSNLSGCKTHLSQLHDLVLQSSNPSRLALGVDGSIGEDHTVLLDLPRELELQRAHAALDDSLDLVGKVRLDILLEATEEEGAKDLVETTNDEERLLFVDLDLVLSTRVGEGSVEPLVEGLDGAEDLGEDEVEESPELGQVVLRVKSSSQGSPCRRGESERTWRGVPVRMRR